MFQIFGSSCMNINAVYNDVIFMTKQSTAKLYLSLFAQHDNYVYTVIMHRQHQSVTIIKL